MNLEESSAMNLEESCLYRDGGRATVGWGKSNPFTNLLLLNV